MAKIFICYSRENQTAVNRLAEDVEALGHDAWFDQDLSGGQTWWDQILTKIRQTEVFVFALAPKSLDSVACQREYKYAASLGKRILPVLVAEGVVDDTVPPALAAIQRVDHRQPDKKALANLSRAITTIPRA